MKRGKILIVGPVVLDTIKEIELYGGTAGNMSYGLGMLGVKPMLFSLAGNDFLDAYDKHLEKNGVDLRVHIDKKNKTARYYDVLKSSKKRRNWFPNAYQNINKVSLKKIISKKDLEEVTFSIFSSNPPKSATKHIQEFKNYSKKAKIIFDPGPEIYNFSKKGLGKCMSLCNIFIVNEKEYTQAKKILGKDPRKFLQQKIVIETQGEKGSVVFDGRAEARLSDRQGRASKKTTRVPIIKPKRVVDTTGAGDAYRAGLIFGLWRGLPLLKACTLGARLASKNVEYLGCQKYVI